MRIFIAVVLIFYSTVAVSQKINLPKGFKKIVLVCQDSSEALYIRFGNQIINKGFIVENGSKDFLTIKSSIKKASRFNVSFYFTAAVIGNRVTLIPYWRVDSNLLVGTGEQSFTEWSYVKDRNNINNVVFKDIMAMVEDFERISTIYDF